MARAAQQTHDLLLNWVAPRRCDIDFHLRLPSPGVTAPCRARLLLSLQFAFCLPATGRANLIHHFGAMIQVMLTCVFPEISVALLAPVSLGVEEHVPNRALVRQALV